MDREILRKWRQQWAGTLKLLPQTKLTAELNNLAEIASQTENTAQSRMIVHSLLVQYGAFQVSQRHTLPPCFSKNPSYYQVRQRSFSSRGDFHGA